ncbi:MAG: hypothetical protein V1790_15610 [Planctomycetota bacterium]
MTNLPTTPPMRRANLSARVRRSLRRVAPVVAWLGAVALAMTWPTGGRGFENLAGFAEVDTFTVNPIEAGVVRRVHVQLHSHVELGQMLVEMDDQADRIRLSVIQVEVERLQAEVAAEEALLAMQRSRAEVRSQDVLRQFLGDREAAHVEYLRFLVSDSQSQAELQGAKVELELVQGFYGQNFSPFRELNNAQTQVNALQAVVDSNHELLERARQRYEDADRRWYNYAESVGSAGGFDAVLTPLRLAVDVQRLEVEELARRINSRILRSPVSGQVTSLTSHAGDRVLAGTALVGVSQTTTRRVVAYLPEGRSFGAVLGDRIVVRRVSRVLGMPQEYSGRVSSLAAIEAEVPIRHRSVSTVPTWGRAMVVMLENGADLLPGEAATLRFAASAP